LNIFEEKNVKVEKLSNYMQTLSDFLKMLRYKSPSIYWIAEQVLVLFGNNATVTYDFRLWKIRK
jgi:hypothetical protein